MKNIQANFYIKNEKREEFLADILPLVDSSRLEKGCIKYHLYESVEEKNNFVMIENWTNQDAIDKHNQNPLLLTLFARIPEYSDKKTEIVVTEMED